jgi:tetratricopeptide (TPR) repeat protein
MTVTAYLWLFPMSGRHAMFAGAYLVGIAGGFVVHFVIRGLVQNFAGATRRRVLILTLLGGARGPRLYPRELKAIELYVHQDWRRLTRLLESTHGEMRTTALDIIHASMDYSRGYYERALGTVDTALAQPARTEELVTYLLLLKALCLSDIGRESETFETLDQALRLQPECTLTNCLYALRRAEHVPLDRPPTAAVRRILKRAYVRMRRALRLAERDQQTFWNAAIDQTVPQAMAFWSVVVAQAVPVTGTFLLDAWSYVALRNGDLHPSKAVFLHCTRTDPKFASPFLHLGEWYVIQRGQVKHRDVRRLLLRRASICLHIAVALEGAKDSMVKRRARRLLDELEEL